MYKRFLKPILDKLIALIGIVLISPLLLLIMLALFLFQNGDVFFVQLRPGKGAKIFSLIKFKTMNDKRDSNGNLLPDADRLTTVGKWVRKLSLDELLQLINVLKGDMSLIGPRPWLVEYLPLYNNFQRRRHEIRPGITGWAQVNGRNMASWDKRFEYDIYYVDNVSFILDFKIILMTIWNVITAHGVSEEGEATMHKFRGNE